MARNFLEAKQYLVNETRKILKELRRDERIRSAIRDEDVEILFVQTGGSLAFVAVSWYGTYKDPYARTYSLKVVFDEDIVRANIHNIENPAFEDLIIHEISHVVDEIINKKSSGHRKPFREIYKRLGGTSTGIGLRAPRDIYSYDFYYGSKKYGLTPKDIVHAKLTMCQGCREIGVYPYNIDKCRVCGGDLIHVKNVPPKEVIKYRLLKEKGTDQDYLRAKYEDVMPKFAQQKARKKKGRKLVTPNILKNLQKFI